MLIKGLQKLTLLDFPGRIACTVFTGGCNFRCPFCHNASLVLPGRDAGIITEEELFAFLNKRIGKLGGVCVSGGEPTLQPDLAGVLERIKYMGFAVKLDTNGYRPDVLRSLIARGLVDYIAMDVKNSLGKYGVTVGIPDFDTSPILESIELIRASGLEHEFRTTLVRELHRASDTMEMAYVIGRDEKYFLQRFVDSGDLISPGLSSHTDDELSVILRETKK